MNSTITVRLAEPADYPAIGAITVDAYRADKQLEAGVGYADSLRDVAGRAAVGEVLVAVDDAGEILGSVTFVLPGTPYAEVSEPGEAEFRMLAVVPSAWGRGIGALLARACVDRARQLGASAVMICARDFAATAQTMYLRLGFVRVPARDWTPVEGVNLLALRLELEPGRY